MWRSRDDRCGISSSRGPFTTTWRIIASASLPSHRGRFPPARYRTNADGKLYCSSSMSVGATIMAYPVAAAPADENVRLDVNKTAGGDFAVTFTAPDYDFVEASTSWASPFITEHNRHTPSRSLGARRRLRRDVLLHLLLPRVDWCHARIRPSSPLSAVVRAPSRSLGARRR